MKQYGQAAGINTAGFFTNNYSFAGKKDQRFMENTLLFSE
jgi:hypothetical protein